MFGFTLSRDDPGEGTWNVMMTAPVTLRLGSIAFNLQKSEDRSMHGSETDLSLVTRVAGPCDTLLRLLGVLF